MKRAKDIFNSIESYIGAILLAIMLILLAYQVITRWTGVSNSWSEEIARYMFVWVVYVGGSLAAIHGAHIKVSTLLLIWPKKIRPYIEILGTVLWVLLSGLLAYYATDFAIRLHINQTISLGLQISMLWPYLGLAVGYILLTIRIIQCQLLPQIKEVLGNKTETIEEVI